MAGDPNGPLLGILVVLAACGALVASSPDDSRPSVPLALTGAAAISIALAGSVLSVTEAAAAFGVPHDHALALAVVVAAAGAVLRRVRGVPAAALLLSPLALTGVVTSMAVNAGALPWVAWARLASEPALTFPAAATWVTEGRAVPRNTTVTFAESHRLTALSSGVFRVTEAGHTGVTVRDWRLGEGDSLTLRAGDRLTLAEGTRVRFEPGRRIPGAAASGVAWAEPRTRSVGTLLDALGLAITLGGGAMVLIGAFRPSSRWVAVAAPMAIVILVVGVASWGVYGAWLAPDLAIGASPLASFVAAPLAAVPPGSAPELTALLALAAGGLLFATAASLVCRLDELVAPWSARLPVRLLPALLGGCALLGAAALSWRAGEAESVLRFGLGLGAAAWVAPRLAGSGRGSVLGAITGGLVVVLLALAPSIGQSGAAILHDHPALVAAPLAATVALLARRRRDRMRGAERARTAASVSV